MFEPVKIAPSILSADFMNLADSVRCVEDAGAGFIHVDVMDGHFVPNLSIGVPVLAQLASCARIPLDVHLMIDNPLRELPWFLDALAKAADPSACIVSVHAEALYGEEIDKAIEMIHTAGLQAALALKPRSAPEVLFPYLGSLDMVLVMSVEPGFSGQSYIAKSEDRVARVCELARAACVAPLIEVDGGIGEATAPLVAAAGADVLVCGNAVFGASDPAAALRSVQARADAARLGAEALRKDGRVEPSSSRAAE